VLSYRSFLPFFFPSFPSFPLISPRYAVALQIQLRNLLGGAFLPLFSSFLFPSFPFLPLISPRYAVALQIQLRNLGQIGEALVASPSEGHVPWALNTPKRVRGRGLGTCLVAYCPISVKRNL